MTRASSFADDPALYGWLLRRATSGWRRGGWQRRFFVLVPKSSWLLYFHRGLHTREVQLCRNADPSAPAARGTIPLAMRDARSAVAEPVVRGVIRREVQQLHPSKVLLIPAELP